MSNTVIKLGAPSLTGKDANQIVAEAFAHAKYPLAVKVKNHMPRDVVFPEVPGLFLKHVANARESEKTVTIASHDLFQRVASSIEQIAELNRYELAVTISGDPGDKKPSDGLSREQIADALKAKGIAAPANAKKADLAALLDAPAGDGVGEGADGSGNDNPADGQSDGK